MKNIKYCLLLLIFIMSCNDSTDELVPVEEPLPQTALELFGVIEGMIESGVDTQGIMDFLDQNYDIIKDTDSRSRIIESGRIDLPDGSWVYYYVFEDGCTNYSYWNVDGGDGGVVNGC